MLGGKCETLDRMASPLQMWLLRERPRWSVEASRLRGRAGLAKGTVTWSPKEAPLRHARGTAKRPDWGPENRGDGGRTGEPTEGRQGPAGPCEDPALSLVRRLATGQGCAQWGRYPTCVFVGSHGRYMDPERKEETGGGRHSSWTNQGKTCWKINWDVFKIKFIWGGINPVWIMQPKQEVIRSTLPSGRGKSYIRIRKQIIYLAMVHGKSCTWLW